MILKNLFAIFSLTFLVSCGTKVPEQYETEVSLLKKTDFGFVMLKSVGYGNGRILAIEDAQKKAFFTLLFRGIPDSDYSYPLIENEIDFKTSHRDFYENFFNNGVYKSFIMVNTESSNLMSTYRGSKIYLDITINQEALRRYLEQNSVIRKFGY